MIVLASETSSAGHGGALELIEGPVITLPVLPGITGMFFIIIILLLLLAFILGKRMKPEVKGFQNLAEMAIDYVSNLIESFMGKDGRRFLPFFATIFLFILFSNMVGLIPGFKSPTSSLNTTAALALIVFFSTHYFGIKEKGFFGYFKHFMGPPYWLAPLFFPIHIIGELARPLSLSIRLFGNIMAKEILLGLLAYFFAILYFRSDLPSKILMAVPVLLRPAVILLGVILGFVQALIFTCLSMIYIGSAIAHEEEH